METPLTYFNTYIVSRITKSTISAHLHHMIAVYSCHYATCNLMYKLYKTHQIIQTHAAEERLRTSRNYGDGIFQQRNRRSHAFTIQNA